VVERWFELRAAALILASLSMLLAISMPAVAAQAPDGGVPGGSDPATQPEPVQVAPAGLPVSTPAEPLADPPSEAPLEPSVGPPAGVPGNCDHAAGEFLVGYVSEEALGAAPQGNVVETFDGILAQHLVFEDIKNIADPAARLAAEEAKRQELSARPDVAYAEYNCTAQANQAAAAPEATPKAAPALPPSICANCGRSVVEKAGRILDGEFEGKNAYDAALDAARTTNDGDKVALASETVSGEEDAGSDSAGADSGTGAESEGSSGSRESSGSEEEPADASAGKVSASSDTEAEPGEEDAGLDAEPVSQRNLLSSGLPQTASSLPVLVVGAGVLLLAAGLLVAHRTFGK